VKAVDHYVLALYRGESVAAAKLLALTAEPELVRDFAERILARPEEQEADAVLAELEHGRQRALDLVKDEARQAPRRSGPSNLGSGPSCGVRGERSEPDL
jgi:hypothetical protein